MRRSGLRFGLSVLSTAMVAVGVFAGGCVSKGEHQTALDEAQELRDRNSELTNENTGLKTQIAGLQNENATLRAQLTQPAQPITADDGGSARGGRVAPERSEERITLSGSNMFPSGSDQLTASAKRDLDNVVSRIRREYSNADIRVEGYSDNTPIRKSKWGTNEALSQARAESVRTYMISKGISSSRIDAIGYGAVSRNGRPPSRRVEIVIMN